MSKTNLYGIIKEIYAAATEKNGVETGVLGKTVLGFPIPYIKKGHGCGNVSGSTGGNANGNERAREKEEKRKEALIFGAIHAREYVTAPLVLKMSEKYAGETAVYFVPAVNIDGLALSIFGIDFVEYLGRLYGEYPHPRSADRPNFRYACGLGRRRENPAALFCECAEFFGEIERLAVEKTIAQSAFLSENFQKNSNGFGGGNSRGPAADTSDELPLSPFSENLLKINGYSRDFSLWKANIDAVDLNVNFDADWGGGAQNVRYPAPANFIGPYPESEPETRALVNFTKSHDFFCVLCYHSKGDLIYYGYGGRFPDREFAEQISRSTGYPLTQSENSAGGYKDWFTLKFDRPALTVEVGGESFSRVELLERFDEIYDRNSNVASIIDRFARERKRK
ncbi:MAG: hypothetical protein LBP79_03005 [Clostridiales bacterium]|jgi:hypothetical protein|nr:hypothetical protein [Clostridiales bacterium]